MAAEAGRQALADAGIGFTPRCSRPTSATSSATRPAGQQALYRLGMTGIPIVNVNNNCSTGSTALFLARQAIESGAAECVLALGFEQMNPGALGTVFNDRPSPFEDFDRDRGRAGRECPICRWPALLRRRRRGPHGQVRHAARSRSRRCALKASRHAARNPLALLRKELTVDEVMSAPMLWPGVLTRLMACPPTCGAAAAVLVSAAFADVATACGPSVHIARAGDDDRHARQLRAATT